MHAPECASVERLLVPDAAFRTHHWTSKLQANVFERIAGAAVVRATPPVRRIYLSRSSTPIRPLTNEAVANRHFATLEALDTALSARCCTLAAMPEIIQAETRFDWWPATAVAN